VRLNYSPRKSAPVVVWLFLGVLLAAMLALAALAALTWRKTQEVGALRAEVQTLQSEQQAADAQLAALQGTTTALEDRMTTLEANDPAQQLAALQAKVETAGDPAEMDNLQASLAVIQSQVDSLQAALDGLAARIEALEPASTSEPPSALPDEVHLAVARQQQSHNLSCESSAASMAAHYQGLALSEADVLGALPRDDNPNLGFRGNVDGSPGGIQDYGVYAGPILDILNAQGLRASLVAGGLAGVRAALARGNPVIAWVTYNCLPSTPTTVSINGADVVLVPNQHAVVVTGYNAQGLWANDPWDGQEDFYSTADLQRAMGYFGYMAIEVAP
jgi:uncharacterized protein YvpB/prefoldin subunit 5